MIIDGKIGKGSKSAWRAADSSKIQAHVTVVLVLAAFLNAAYMLGSGFLLTFEMHRLSEKSVTTSLISL